MFNNSPTIYDYLSIEEINKIKKEFPDNWHSVCENLSIAIIFGARSKRA